MDSIREEKEAEVDEENDSEEETEFNIRKYLDQECEKMLKEIQRKNYDQFLDIFQDLP
jgi:hypothetical protein